MKIKSSVRTIQSVHRAIDILNIFDFSRKEISLSEICDATKLNKSTTYGLISTLLKNGYLDKDQTSGKYTLGGVLLAKASTRESPINVNISALGSPKLDVLVNQYCMTGTLFAHYANTLTCLRMLSPINGYSVTFELETNMAYHAAASGKLLLAHYTNEEVEKILTKSPFVRYTDSTIMDINTLLNELEIIRARGYSIEDDEIQIGIFSIASPIYEHNDIFAGTMSLTGATQATKMRLKNIIEDITTATKEISSFL